MNNLADYFSRDDLVASCGRRAARRLVVFGRVLLDDFVANRHIGIPVAAVHGGTFGKAVYPKLTTARLGTGREQPLGERPRSGGGGSSLCLS